VLLHANPGDSRDFEAVTPQLARHHRVIALDWPGYGRSAVPQGPKQWDALSFYRVLCEFLDRMRLARAAFVGNSLGGNAAARLAIEAPERVSALVLVSPGGFTPHNLITRGFCRLQGSFLSLPPRWWAAIYLRRRTEITSAMLARAAGEHSTPACKTLNRAVWRSFARPEHDLRLLADRVVCPALLVFGHDDPAISARKDGREAQRCMPHAQAVTMPCGHAPFAELPEMFLKAAQPFLLALRGAADGLPGTSPTPVVGPTSGAVPEAKAGELTALRNRLR
jgi:pimeloyl-ACP methyl ester carboxylesterase